MTDRRGGQRSDRSRAQSGATTNPPSISPIGSPQPEHVSSIVSAIEDTATVRLPSRDTWHAFNRLAFASANAIISEGYLTQHSKLPSEVKKFLDPIKCIPLSIKEKVTYPSKPSLICAVQRMSKAK
jgi:hypothetical protein